MISDKFALEESTYVGVVSRISQPHLGLIPTSEDGRDLPKRFVGLQWDRRTVIVLGGGEQDRRVLMD